MLHIVAYSDGKYLEKTTIANPQPEPCNRCAPCPRHSSCPPGNPTNIGHHAFEKIPFAGK
jgi:hypothetical protein